MENCQNHILLLYNFALREQPFSESFMLVVVIREIDMEGALSKAICTYIGTTPEHGFPPAAVNEPRPLDGW